MLIYVIVFCMNHAFTSSVAYENDLVLLFIFLGAGSHEYILAVSLGLSF
ncbi:hypothetical protein F383_02138 [Gossypium arboreum]|uniref:Uncharacterized protein n=1 Tax=Gossypium arboreum TaxID=29729 RepID=A0A0B0NDI2_GOSAR|nr:hypothetical protein F383_02138 [Gossypium arboreum]